MTTEEKLVALEERIATLETALAAREHTTMRRSKRCPCGSHSILHVEKLRTEHNDIISLQKGVLFYHGAMEAYVCRSCKLVEIYVASFDGVKIDDDNVKTYATNPPPGEPSPDPYR